ncbi:hypothetical protein A3Q56_00605 [Intoshia linei]|uniref:Uncharacterized protein n=1 Tax=Intoshia linei TaxID=1819745 RepID=A0A177BDJ2_9BILA|nr:hypothetical protein A3Q56_00605 [Intoshia linei]
MTDNSQIVKNGGFWNPGKSHTDLINESKLTMFQRRQINDVIKDGQILSLRCNPHSSKYNQDIVLKKSKIEKNNYIPKLRKKQDIIDGGLYEREKYIPRCNKIPLDENEKKRYINLLVYGKNVKKKNIEAQIKFKKRLLNEKLKSMENFDNDFRFNELNKEINERENFLQEMKMMGKEMKYKNQINFEISQRLREMELLDKKIKQ